MMGADLALTRPLGAESGWDALQALFDLDVIVAAWGWDDVDVERTTGYSQRSRRAFRNHEQPIPEMLVHLVTMFWLLHVELWMSCPSPYSWREWWRNRWDLLSPIGPRSPLDAVAEDRSEALARLIKHYRQMRSGDFT